MNLFKLRIWIYKQRQKLRLTLFPIDHDTDKEYFDAVDYINGKSYITYNQLQRGLNIGYARTSQIMELLEKNRKIGSKENDKEKRKVIK